MTREVADEAGTREATLQELEALLEQAWPPERETLRRRLRELRKRFSARGLEAVRRDLHASVHRSARRRALEPVLHWPDLPVVAHRQRLREVIAENQVVVVAGETGSGKTTQLPKICLELGRGRDGMIGHTQPRRLAARSVSARLAEELTSEVGGLVGYRVRFTDQVGEDTLVKLMTDGMLLAEFQGDALLSRYDTLIIDEAHERSLNIDFLLGIIRQLLPRRPDLKVIITSATIDHERFSRHFGNAPVVEVSGRTWPVEVRYREPPGQGDYDLNREVEAVLAEIAREERGDPPAARDVLVFLSGEREIRDLHHHLRRCHLPDTEILPLYARLGRGEQNRVFEPHRGRRVVLATNVAETSLTVPGIRYVIDAGTARISRYSVHSKVQRLPVEPISRASAAQRAGRAGRVMPGICYRLYSEEDFLARPEFTDPEIRRTNLASVILRMADAGLGRVDEFPFLDPPDGRLVRDGYRLLEELGAQEGGRLTDLGRQLARLPLDPRLGRMVLAAWEKGALEEVLVIVSALSVQDPRERPAEKTQQADEAHRPFTDRDSDFLFFLNLWRCAEEERQARGRNQYEKWLKKNFLSPARMRDWRDTHRQLLLQCREMGMHARAGAPADHEAIHRSLLTGLLGHVVKRTEQGEWLSTRNRKPVLWAGSALAKSKASWLMAAELVDTGRLFARTLARVEPEWIEAEGAHRVKRRYLEPHWSKKRGCVMAKEQVSLFGLPLISGRRVHYGPIDPPLAREILIREALVAGNLREEPEFVRHNRQLVAELEEVEHKLRRRGLLADEQVQVDFYIERLPGEFYTLAGVLDWYRKHATAAQRQALHMDASLLLPEEPDLEPGDFPDELELDGLRLPLEYSFDPRGSRDGVTLVVPVEVLNQVPEGALQWLVPGLLPELLEKLLRGLPKARRRHFVPVPEYVRALGESLRAGAEPLLPALTRQLQRMTGVRVEQEEWEAVELPEHLRMHVRVMEGEQVLAEGRDLASLKEQFAHRAGEAVRADNQAPEREARQWEFGEVPEVREVKRSGVSVRVWPALVDRGDRVAEVLHDSEAQARLSHRQGTARLLALRLSDPVRALEKRARSQPGFQKMAADRTLAGRELPGQVVLFALIQHFDLDAAPVRDEQAFRRRLDERGGDFMEAAERWLDWFSEMLAAYRELRRRLEGDFPLAWAHVHRDLGTQLGALVFPEFPLRVPAEWLQQYPRYFSAIEHRLERLGGHLGEDRARVAELEELWEQYCRRAGDRPLQTQPEPLQRYRWMLEEYRVSLFAQHLGTRMPVSAKRLRKQWEEC